MKVLAGNDLQLAHSEQNLFLAQYTDFRIALGTPLKNYSTKARFRIRLSCFLKAILTSAPIAIKDQNQKLIRVRIRVRNVCIKPPFFTLVFIYNAPSVYESQNLFLNV